MGNFAAYVIFLKTIASIVFFSFANEIHDELDVSNLSSVDPYSSKHPSLFECINVVLGPEEFVLFPNGTAYIKEYNQRFNESFYILTDGNLTICTDDEYWGSVEEDNPNYLLADSLQYLTIVGIAISMICMFLHLVIFALVPEIRNLPESNLASLCLSLFVSYVFIFLGTSDAVANLHSICVSVALGRQFFLLSAALWMFVISSAVFRSIFQATSSLRITCNEFSWKKYGVNSIIAWGIASIFTIASLLADTIEGTREDLKPNFHKNCWFYSKKSLYTFFAVPFFVIITLNLIIFLISSYMIFINRMKMNDNSQRINLKKNYFVYFRLAIITGLTWVTGIAASWTDFLWLWYLFVVLNTLQGLFIFITFTCTKKEVRTFFRNKFHEKRRISEVTVVTTNVTPTFQSYCPNVKAFDKDTNKPEMENTTIDMKSMPALM